MYTDEKNFDFEIFTSKGTKGCGEIRDCLTFTTAKKHSLRFGVDPDRPGGGDGSIDRLRLDPWSGPTTTTKFVSRLERFWRAAPSGVKRALFGYFQPRAEVPAYASSHAIATFLRSVLLPTEFRLRFVDSLWGILQTGRGIWSDKGVVESGIN